MKIKFLIILGFLSLLCAFPRQASAALTQQERIEIIDRELNCLSQKMNQDDYVDWGNVCYTESEDEAKGTMEESLTSVNSFEVAPIIVTSEPVENDYATDYEDDYDSSYVEEDTIAPQDTIYKSEAIRKTPSSKEFWTYDNLFARENPLTKLEVGFEFYRMIYEEPGLMKDQGNMYGINLAYTYRTSNNDHINSFNDIFTDTNKINMFKVEFDMSQGELDYKSEGTGSIEDIEDRKLEIRGLMGYDIPLRNNTLLTPYVGVGYRYLNDDAGGRASNTGALGYERENKCYYMPIGLQTETKIKESWKIGLNLEYDLFLDGQQISHLEDIGPWLTDSKGDTYAIDPLKNEQYEGFGLRASMNLVKLNKSFDVFLRPYVNYWKKEQSDWTQFSSQGGSLVWYTDDTFTTPIIGWEPENRTWEYGMKMGIMF